MAMRCFEMKMGPFVNLFISEKTHETLQTHQACGIYFSCLLSYVSVPQCARAGVALQLLGATVINGIIAREKKTVHTEVRIVNDIENSILENLHSDPIIAK